jgi:hypothetical protein
MLPEKLEGKEIQEYFKNLIRDDSKYTHVNYKNTVAHAEEMAVHAWGEKPTDILGKARPREEDAVKQYRLDSWEPITQSKFDKAIYILQKIFNPRLFSVVFPPQPGGIKLKEEETLEYYTRFLYPQFDDVFNFFSEVLLKQMIADPNGVIAIVPTKYDLPQNEFQNPVAVLFGSSQVLDKKDGVYFVLKDQNTVKFNYGREGVILHVFTLNSIITYHELEKENRERSFVEVAKYDHNFGMMPVWHLGGVTESRTYPYSYKSFFNAALPFWNKAVRLESDLDGALVNHLHPQKWEMTLDCEYSDENQNMCNGGVIFNPVTNRKHTCSRCKGTGKISVKSPYEVYQISTDKIKNLEGNVSPIPPAGYITVPTEIINILKQTVAENLENGLSAICMDVVNKIGENQSGTAKEIDRTELNSFMGKVSDYLFDNHIPNFFYFINKFRYGVILGNKTDDYLPIISKPTHFDILSIQDITEEIAKAKENNANSMYLTALELDLIDKRFSTNEDIKVESRLSLELNPFPNYSVEDKMNMSLDGTVSKKDVVISNNIIAFVKRAIEEEDNFLELERMEQMSILKGYAEELLKDGTTQAKDLLEPTQINRTGQVPIVEGETEINETGSISE